MSRSKTVPIPRGVRGEEVEVKLVGVGKVEILVLDGGVLAGEILGAGEVCAWGDQTSFMESSCEEVWREEGVGGGFSVGVVSSADVPHGEGDWDFLLFLFLCVFFDFALAITTAGRDFYGDDFAESCSCVAGSPGMYYLVVQTGPDFGFMVLQVGHEVVPCCGGAEGFD